MRTLFFTARLLPDVSRQTRQGDNAVPASARLGRTRVFRRRQVVASAVRPSWRVGGRSQQHHDSASPLRVCRTSRKRRRSERRRLATPRTCDRELRLTPPVDAAQERACARNHAEASTSLSPLTWLSLSRGGSKHHQPQVGPPNKAAAGMATARNRRLPERQDQGASFSFSFSILGMFSVARARNIPEAREPDPVARSARPV
jgi:hypothetical protein